MNLGTLVVLIVLAGVVTLVIRTMLRDRRSGKTCSCGGDCSKCRGCH